MTPDQVQNISWLVEMGLLAGIGTAILCAAKAGERIATALERRNRLIEESWDGCYLRQQIKGPQHRHRGGSK